MVQVTKEQALSKMDEGFVGTIVIKEDSSIWFAMFGEKLNNEELKTIKYISRVGDGMTRANAKRNIEKYCG